MLQRYKYHPHYTIQIDKKQEENLRPESTKACIPGAGVV